MKKLKSFMLSCLFLLLLSQAVFADEGIVVIDGTDTNDSIAPPEDPEPTVDFIKCPEGYDCIRSEDYAKFMEGITTLGTTLIEQSNYMEAIVERLDKKLTMSEEEKKDYATALLNTQEDVKELRKEYKGQITILTHDLGKAVEGLGIAEDELKIMKATNVLNYLLILCLVFGLTRLYNWAKPQLHFIWRWVQEKIPIKLGNWF